MKRQSFKQIIISILWSVIIAFILTLLLAYCFGFRAFLVKGWSSEPYIPYNSLIIDYQHSSLESLNVGDFITCTNTGTSYVTHRIVAIKKDGFFTADEEVTIYKDGLSKTQKFSEIKISGDTTTNCNIITQQMTQENQGIDKPCELRNYENNFTGKVTHILPFTGQVLNFVKTNIIMIICELAILYVGYIFFKFEPQYVRLF